MTYYLHQQCQLQKPNLFPDKLLNSKEFTSVAPDTVKLFETVKLLVAVNSPASTAPVLELNVRVLPLRSSTRGRVVDTEVSKSERIIERSAKSLRSAAIAVKRSSSVLRVAI